jgi:hypothetical protein
LPSKHQKCCFKRQKMMVWPANTGLQQTFEWHGAAKNSGGKLEWSWWFLDVWSAGNTNMALQTANPKKSKKIATWVTSI